ncbi:MAG: dephospho-CoA kinase [Bacteroidaceae bacterium]|nr:dephospho-CoA kinase [Bacteroidaceae bacterium]MCQ2255008.1 dephospho-CoA kinase [Bacteroidaceae bacterium]
MQVVQFNPAQMHVLNMASHIKTEQSLNLLKQQLSAFYAKLIDEQMDELWESGKWNEKKLEELRGAHFRTSY